jgi:hypothetical protein
MGWFGVVCIVFAVAFPVRADELPVRVDLANGTTVEATLVGFDGTSFQLRVGDQPKTIPLADISQINRQIPSDVPQPIMRAGLRGGSRVKVEGLRIEGDQATLLMRRQDPLILPLKQLDWVRFRAPTPAIDPDWLGVVGKTQQEDVLVIRRSNTAVDQAPGIIVGADDKKIDFQLAGSMVPAPLGRLEGVVFANRPLESVSGTTVVDVLGSEWAVTQLAPGSSSETLMLVLAGDVRRELKLEQIDTIRISDGALRLTSLAPIATEFSPLVSTELSQDVLSRWLGPHVDGDKDWVLRSRSSATFRIDADYSKLAALVVADSSVESGAGAIARVRLGDEVVWEQLIVPGKEPKGLEIDVSQASRLTLEVDFGDDEARGDAGDVVRFIEPRFLK